MDKSEPKKEYLRRELEEYSLGEALETQMTKDEQKALNRKTGHHKPAKKSKVMRIVLAIFSVLAIIIIAYSSFIFLKIRSVSNKISEKDNSSLIQDLKSTALALVPSQRKILSGEDEGRINILLLGAAGEKKPGKNLTDTIMIASIDTKSKKVALLSLPRDMYARIPDTNSFTKINGLYQYGLKNDMGVKAIESSVEEIIGQPMHYYLVVDFDGFVKFIDILGGINVNVERDIYDTRYPGPNYSYETFELKKGLQSLDGETALKYVRERHGDPQGDFGRARRQQQVMQSAKNKVFSLRTILNPVKINEILDSLSEHMRTNLALEDIESLLALSKELDTHNISTKVVDAWKKDSLLKVSHIFRGDIRAFILVPRAGNYSQIHELAENVFDIERIEKRKSQIESENGKVLLVNASGDKSLPPKIKELLSESLRIRNLEISQKSSAINAEKTEVVDLTGKAKLFTLDEIIKTVPATLSKNDQGFDSKKFDFVLILGEDVVPLYKFEEEDIESFKNADDTLEYFEILE